MILARSVALICLERFASCPRPHSFMIITSSYSELFSYSMQVLSAQSKRESLKSVGFH